MKFNLFLTSFVIMSIFVMGQSQTITYTDIYGETANENEDWNNKTVEVIQNTEDGQIKILKTFDREGTLIEKKHTELIYHSHYTMESEKYYPEYNCKSISNIKINSQGEIKETNQCLSLDDDLIFSDKVCVEVTNELNNTKQFAERIQSKFMDLYDFDNEIIRLLIRFTVTPDYTIKVLKIDEKFVGSDDINLTSQEQSIIQFIENTPKEYFEGRLTKIAGKTVETLYKLPIIYRNE